MRQAGPPATDPAPPARPPRRNPRPRAASARVGDRTEALLEGLIALSPGRCPQDVEEAAVEADARQARRSDDIGAGQHVVHQLDDADVGQSLLPSEGAATAPQAGDLVAYVIESSHRLFLGTGWSAT